MAVGLAIKTACLKEFPTITAGLAHPDEAISRSFATLVLKMWQDLTPQQRELQLDFTVKFFSGDTVEQLRLHGSGTLRIVLSRVYRKKFAFWRFYPCGERVIESYHKDVKIGTGSRRPGMPYVSLLLRNFPY